jgi:hypothetical protein
VYPYLSGEDMSSNILALDQIPTAAGSSQTAAYCFVQYFLKEFQNFLIFFLEPAHDFS